MKFKDMKEPHGLLGLMEHLISMTSPMETVNSLPWVMREPSLLRRMEPLGIIVLLE